MAKKSKQTALTHCKVTITTHPKAPWRVSFPVEENGVTRRKRRMFSTEQKAYDFACAHEKDVADFGVRFGAITGEARRAFDHYRDARADLAAEGIEFPTFEMLVTNAVASLRREHEERQRARMTVAAAVEAFLAYKKPRVGSGRLEGLGGHLRRFASAFGSVPMDSISGPEIESWISALRSPRTERSGPRPMLNPNSRNTLRKNLKSLFTYGCAPARAWCHRNPLADIEPEKVQQAEPVAYTPAETSAIMAAALAMNSPALPCLALGFFAGLRPSETMAVDLSAINLDADEFRVPATKSNGERTKTGARIAPLTAACKAWLASQPRRSGKAWPEGWAGMGKETKTVMTAAKVTKIFDGFRHSFITYRTAETRDVSRVGDECGNSPNVIKKHYRELVTAEAAKKFFAIRPETPAQNITSIQQGRATA